MGRKQQLAKQLVKEAGDNARRRPHRISSKQQLAMVLALTAALAVVVAAGSAVSFTASTLRSLTPAQRKLVFGRAAEMLSAVGIPGFMKFFPGTPLIASKTLRNLFNYWWPSIIANGMLGRFGAGGCMCVCVCVHVRRGSHQ